MPDLMPNDVIPLPSFRFLARRIVRAADHTALIADGHAARTR
jgi:hypothetical protein